MLLLSSDVQSILECLCRRFQMAGPSAALAPAWAVIRKYIELDPPTKFGNYLGCGYSLERRSSRPNMSRDAILGQLFDSTAEEPPTVGALVEGNAEPVEDHWVHEMGRDGSVFMFDPVPLAFALDLHTAARA